MMFFFNFLEVNKWVEEYKDGSNKTICGGFKSKSKSSIVSVRLGHKLYGSVGWVTALYASGLQWKPCDYWNLWSLRISSMALSKF